MSANVTLSYHSQTFPFPTKEIPAWASDVERWYQLDPFAYLLPQAYNTWKNILNTPGMQILACPGASDFTDFGFVKSQCTSPTKFVHTLPNVRISSLLQVMRWNGPVFSIHRGDRSLSIAMEFAISHATYAPQESIWLWRIENPHSSAKKNESQDYHQVYRVELWCINDSLQSVHALALPSQNDNECSDDKKLLSWFWNKEKENIPFSKYWTLNRPETVLKPPSK